MIVEFPNDVSFSPNKILNSCKNNIKKNYYNLHEWKRFKNNVCTKNGLKVHYNSYITVDSCYYVESQGEQKRVWDNEKFQILKFY